MKYFSTRNSSMKVSASQAIARGLAPDGGLFVPEIVPALSQQEIASLCGIDYRGRALHILSKFLDEFERPELESFVNAAYGENFYHPDVAPLSFLGENTAMLELWHGPTCAFKDMALQMLPHLLTASLRKNGETRQVCVLVATSGDTGKAALEGFKDVEGTRIIVFYPRDGVSDIQKLQMITQTGNNVLVSAVAGNFDDAQAGVKAIFRDRQFEKALDERGFFLSSANSINWGRLLPQIIYYVSAYCDLLKANRIKMGEKVNFCVPTGNFGNILAAWYAKQMGLPVNRLICASNRNNILTDFINTGVYDRNRDFYTTISPSMDILISSNLERLLHALSGDAEVSDYMSQLNETGRYAVSDKIKAAVQSDFAAGYCTDEDTKAEIKRVFREYNYLMDTHTAVAYKVLRDYRQASGDDAVTVVVSTASPFKFAEDVLDALGVNDGREFPLKALAEATGVVSPVPLEGLENRQTRFPGCVEKSEMLSLVDGFLS
ncbi:MAG: threonine synthase [Oscillospiraceae bacterium]|jgi:threonine synthase